MCMSPDEMSTERLEHAIEEIKGWIDADPAMGRFWEGRLEMLEKLLKERAEAGTY